MLNRPVSCEPSTLSCNIQPIVNSVIMFIVSTLSLTSVTFAYSKSPLHQQELTPVHHCSTAAGEYLQYIILYNYFHNNMTMFLKRMLIFNRAYLSRTGNGVVIRFDR